jgi:hypothetical protein
MDSAFQPISLLASPVNPWPGRRNHCSLEVNDEHQTGKNPWLQNTSTKRKMARNFAPIGVMRVRWCIYDCLLSEKFTMTNSFWTVNSSQSFFQASLPGFLCGYHTNECSTLPVSARLSCLSSKLIAVQSNQLLLLVRLRIGRKSSVMIAPCSL